MKCKKMWNRLYFKCPGCKRSHCVAIETGPVQWTWNGSLDKPTFSPSVLYEPSIPEHRCHFFVEDGKIRYLADCHHDLKNTTVEMEEWDE